MDDLGWRTLSDRRKDAGLNLFGKAGCVAGRNNFRNGTAERTVIGQLME